jgi:chorismate mutase
LFFNQESLLMPIRGIRGATVIKRDQPDEIAASTRELLEELQKANPTLRLENIASVIFTSTPDLISAFPASAAREIGWDNVPLLCCQEIPVPESLPLCIRVLIHWNTELTQKEIKHIYLGQAGILRPDLAGRTQ